MGRGKLGRGQGEKEMGKGYKEERSVEKEMGRKKWWTGKWGGEYGEEEMGRKEME